MLVVLLRDARCTLRIGVLPHHRERLADERILPDIDSLRRQPIRHAAAYRHNVKVAHPLASIAT